MDLTNKKTLINYLQSHGLYTKKSLGQNFLVDRSSLDKIVAAAELSRDDCVLEVGPGLGVMTGELVKKSGRVLAVEIDPVLAELMATRHSGSSESKSRDDNLTIINQDILHTNISELTRDCPKYKVVANIPYYITSKIIRFFLEAEKQPETIVLLTQKEVAERICAEPGDMSVLSVSVQYYGQPEIVDIVPRTSFFPAPEVDSAILRITNINPSLSSHPEQGEGSRSSATASGEQFNKSAPSGLDSSAVPQNDRDVDKQFFRCVHHGFASRRKTLLNNLSSGYQLDKDQVLDILNSVGLTDKTRAQELSITNWQILYDAITKHQETISKQYPNQK